MMFKCMGCMLKPHTGVTTNLPAVIMMNGAVLTPVPLNCFSFYFINLKTRSVVSLTQFTVSNKKYFYLCKIVNCQIHVFDWISIYHKIFNYFFAALLRFENGL